MHSNHQDKPLTLSGRRRNTMAETQRLLEPHVGYWHIQDMILVTPATKLLSDRFSTDEMFVID